jgi:hypothetical protein
MPELFSGFANDLEAHLQAVFDNCRVERTVGKIVGNGDFRNRQPVSVNIHNGLKQDVKRFALDLFCNKKPHSPVGVPAIT